MTLRVIASGLKCSGLGIIRSRLAGLRFSGVKIPLSALGFIAIHQKPGFAPHLAVEKLHPQLLASIRPMLQIPRGTRRKRSSGRYCYGHIEPVSPAIEHRLHPPLACFGDTDGGGTVAFDRAGELAGEAATIARCRQASHSRPSNPPHANRRHGGAWRRQDIGDFSLVMRDIAGFFIHLDHQDDATAACLAPTTTTADGLAGRRAPG